MGWLSSLLSGNWGANGPKLDPETGTEPITWADFPPEPPSTDWERRLCAYAKRCARDLSDGNIPRWITTGFEDGFWVVSIDVVEGARWHQHKIPPISNHPELFGTQAWISGPALLLTRCGTLVEAAIEGTGKAGETGRVMQEGVKFSNPSFLNDKWRDLSWADGNLGYWRDAPSRNVKYKGLTHISLAEEFRGRWPFRNKLVEPGLGTIGALRQYIDSDGKTGLPRSWGN